MLMMPDHEVAIVVRMPASLRDALKARAEREDRSMAQTIRYALREYVQQPTTERILNP